MIVAGGQSFLAANTPFTKYVSRCNDGTIVAVSSSMALAAAHFDARGETDWAGVTATARNVHPLLDLAKVQLSAAPPGFHTRASRPTTNQQLVLAGTGVTATYGSNAAAAFDYTTRALRSGYAKAIYYSSWGATVAACIEDPASGSSFQPSVTCAIHDSGSGCFDTSGNLLGIVVSTFYMGPALAWTGYPGYTDTADNDPIGGAGVILLDLVKHWIDAGYDAPSIALVEVLYSDNGTTQTPVSVRVRGSDPGSWPSAVGSVVINFAGTAYRNTAAPTLSDGNATATYALSAGGALPAANCCNLAAALLTRTSDSAATSAATALRYLGVVDYTTPGGVSLGSPQLRNDGTDSEDDIEIFLRNNTSDMQPSKFVFDRTMDAASLLTFGDGVMFRGLFDEGWAGLAESLRSTARSNYEVWIDSSGSWLVNRVVSASASNVGTPAGRGVVNINGLGDGFVYDGGNATAVNKSYTNRRATFKAPTVSIGENAGTFTAIGRGNNVPAYFEFTAPASGKLSVTKTGTVNPAAGSGYLIRVSRLDSVAPLSHIAEQANGTLSDVPIVAGARYLIGLRNLSGSTGTLGATVAITPKPATPIGSLPGGPYLPGEGYEVALDYPSGDYLTNVYDEVNCTVTPGNGGGTYVDALDRNWYGPTEGYTLTVTPTANGPFSFKVWYNGGYVPDEDPKSDPLTLSGVAGVSAVQRSRHCRVSRVSRITRA